MNDDSPPRSSRPPHPLAIALIERLRKRGPLTVLEIGRGSGRNTAALAAAGFDVAPLDAAVPASCAGALSSHALLHGTPHAVESMLEAIHRALEPGAPLYATFGSTRDARFGCGTRIEPNVYAPETGDEAGVAHGFFDRQALIDMLSGAFTIESLDEWNVDDIAGSWAHQRNPLRDAIHWFALLRRKGVAGVRALQPADRESWLRMRAGLWPGETIDDDAGSERVFVYEDTSGSLHGMLELSLRSHAEGSSNSPVPFIEAWYVDEHTRGRGIGRALVEAAEQWALAHGFAEIGSDTQLWNESSAHAHEALGFAEVERTIHFHKTLIARER